MNYTAARISTSFNEEWQADLFAQQLFDMGFDSEERLADGHAVFYIPTDIWTSNRKEIEALCRETKGVSLLSAEACPDENWNAAWEAEQPMQELPLGVKIIPHCAFGAGHHETTSMMIEALIKHQSSFADHRFPEVLDHGTGTGVLAIFAKRLGAARVMAVDIDDKSVENAKENAALNGVEIKAVLGSSVPEGHYDLILANIHRNVLLANMSAYAASLTANGELWLSGFYEEDCPSLIAEAQKNGLRHLATHANGEWRMMEFIASRQ